MGGGCQSAIWRGSRPIRWAAHKQSVNGILSLAYGLGIAEIPMPMMRKRLVVVGVSTSPGPRQVRLQEAPPPQSLLGLGSPRRSDKGSRNGQRHNEFMSP